MAILTLSAILLFSCSDSPSVSQTAPSKPGAVNELSASDALPKAAWEQDWASLQKAAKQEKRLSVYGSAGASLRDVLIKDFGKKHGIDVEVITGRGAEVAARVAAERRAGLYIADVYIGGSTNNVQMKNDYPGIFLSLPEQFILPDLKEPELIKKVWWNGKLRWMDKEQRFILANLAFASTPLLINTNLVKDTDIRSYNDLLDPRWKGKIIFNDPTVTGTGSKVFGVIGGEILGYDFMRKLTQHDIVVIEDQRLMVEWVAQGKKAILLGTKPEIVYEFIRSGAPLKYIWAKEGGYVSSGTGCISVFSNTPHPNAAKLLLNWFMSKEGVEIWSQVYGSEGARLDTSKEGLDPVWFKEPGKDYFLSDLEAFVSKQAEQIKLAKEIFGPLMK